MLGQDHIATIKTGFKAVNNHEFDAFLKMVAPDYKMYLVLKPEILQLPGGMVEVDAIKKYLEMLYTAFPDYHLKTGKLEATGDMVYQEMVLHGTHHGPLFLPNGTEVGATGRTINTPIEVFHNFDKEGVLINSTAYANVVLLMKQFGSE